MKIRRALILPLIVSMLLGIVMLGPVGAQATTIGVEPVETIDPGLGPGENFTVEIWVRDVTNLGGVEFTLGYDTAVLTATNITYGGIFGVDYMEWGSEIDDAAGFLRYSITVFFGDPGMTGDGRAAILNFTVDSVGESALDLYDTILGDDSSPPNPISHGALAGYFNNIPEPTIPLVTLARRRAWPEHYDFYYWKELARGEDNSNDLFAIVKNDGTGATYVKVVFTITDETGGPIGEVETATILLPAGATIGDTKYNRYYAAFVPPPPIMGKYGVSAVAWADGNADGIPEFPMGNIKTFSFNVLPTTE